MEQSLKDIIWRQFGASIDMLENAIRLCPEANWDGQSKFWYNAYHCLFFLDYYLTLDPSSFTPPQPFTLSEFEDEIPERAYTKEELLDYLRYCKGKCQKVIREMTPETANRNWTNVSGTMNFPVIEILLYNMRHVQHHAAQLNLILRQEIDNAPTWVSRAKDLE